MNYLKKLSIATMNAIPKGIKELEHGATVAIAHIIGIAEGIETGTSQFGEWVAFTGAFKGTVLDGGEMFRAGKCLLPGIASDALQGAVTENAPVEFALEIGIRRVIKLDPKGNEVGMGYEYTMRPLIEMDAASDPLTALEAKVKVPALEAPKTEAEAPKAEAEKPKAKK